MQPTDSAHFMSSRSRDMFRAIEAMLPRLRERAARTRALRRLPDETVQELRDIGFFLTLQPRRYGGYELPPADFFRMQMRLAEACMSTAWAGGIIAVHSFQLALFDDRAQQEVWGNDIHTRISSSYAPVGKVTVGKGGFHLSGRWGWSSGSDHCAWVLLGAIVPGEGYRTFLVPRRDYRIEDTWQAMGLQGTGSNDIVVEDAWVPDYRTHKQLDGFNLTNPGTALNDAPLFKIPWGQIFVRTVSTPAIGAAKAAVSLYRDLVTHKASSDPTKLAGDTETQSRIATAVNAIDEMEVVLLRNMLRMQEQVAAGETVPIADRVRYRYQAALVIERCMTVIDSLFSVAGGRSVFLGAEIQQCFLDVHTARAHVANNPTAFARNLGAIELGLENQDVFI